MLKTIKAISYDVKPLTILYVILSLITYLNTEYRVLGFRGVLILFFIYLFRGILEDNNKCRIRNVYSTAIVILIILSHYLYYWFLNKLIP